MFLANARGSLLELDTHLELSLRLEYITDEQHFAVKCQLDEVGRILNGLLRSLN